MATPNTQLFTMSLTLPKSPSGLTEEARLYLRGLAKEKGSALLYATRGPTHAFPINTLYRRPNVFNTRKHGSKLKVKHETWDPHVPLLPGKTMGWLPRGCKEAKCPEIVDTPFSPPGPGGGGNILVLVLKHTSHTQLELMLPRLNLAMDANRSAIDLSTWYAATQRYVSCMLGTIHAWYTVDSRLCFP
jgi:hypothetical protein